MSEAWHTPGAVLVSEVRGESQWGAGVHIQAPALMCWGIVNKIKLI